MRNKPVCWQSFDLNCNLQDLAVCNPNHLKQFLKNHPSNFENFDLSSLKILFIDKKIPAEILHHIELRGVVPNTNMQRLRITNK